MRACVGLVGGSRDSFEIGVLSKSHCNEQMRKEELRLAELLLRSDRSTPSVCQNEKPPSSGLEGLGGLSRPGHAPGKECFAH